MGNASYVWDGSTWQVAKTNIYDGKAWKPVGEIPMYDGHNWRSGGQTPEEFPMFVAARSATFRDRNHVSLSIPPEVAMGDIVVSLCASYGSVTKPANGLRPVVDLLKLRPSDIHLTLNMFLWTPDCGYESSFESFGEDDNMTVANLVYRHGDTSSIPAKPVISYKTYEGVDRAALDPADDFTTLYVAIAASKDMTAAGWPRGVQRRVSEHGPWQTETVHIMAADTVGSGFTPGDLVFDSLADQLAIAVITIPGKQNPDGKPTWILGDQRASVLGFSTVLE
ncbi:hypothetical protein [Streptomyces sp. CBMA123]|uniref:hypothetical protein n=1 Tax=Streptomyces sp. CBMA123 TaxID=1896313 RepID=UPI001661D146|nr:hypothetical protein [Streptomyces sp. CBMA123]MBD0689648.1 hypothetical protein [Streptomyces sp. CBMA123]